MDWDANHGASDGCVHEPRLPQDRSVRPPGEGVSSSASTLVVELRTQQPFLDIRFEIGAGVTVLFGTSGVGKTTVLECIAGTRKPQAGRVTFGDETWFDAHAGVNMRPERRHIGYVPQTLALFPHMTAAENVAFGVVRAKLDAQKQPREVAREWLARMVIAERSEAYPRQLSGGERQRVAFARAMARAPRLLLLDEPFSALDTAMKTTLIEDVVRLLREWRIPVLLVTHDIIEAHMLGERVIEIGDGRVLREGSVAQVLGKRRDELLRALADVAPCRSTEEH